MPKQNSSGGKDRLGSISKQGNRYLRSLFTAGALAVIRYAKIHGTIRGLQKGIGEQLRATYEELLNEDIPTDHTDLLQRLERNEASSEVTLKR